MKRLGIQSVFKAETQPLNSDKGVSQTIKFGQKTRLDAPNLGKISLEDRKNKYIEHKAGRTKYMGG